MTDREALWIAFIVIGCIVGAIIWYAVKEPACPREQKGWNCRAGTKLACECEVREVT
jgi:hypothetical protein